ncbi:MAG TPA: hypothetical protein PKE45_13135 [Caldilineaceae bacterium]|nr:hypothetical protein [Caldilineaceae bacterium]
MNTGRKRWRFPYWLSSLIGVATLVYPLLAQAQELAGQIVFLPLIQPLCGTGAG